MSANPQIPALSANELAFIEQPKVDAAQAFEVFRETGTLTANGTADLLAESDKDRVAINMSGTILTRPSGGTTSRDSTPTLHREKIRVSAWSPSRPSMSRLRGGE